MSDLRCTEPRTGDLLAAYGLGALDEPDRARFETHLAECAFCLEELYCVAPVDEALRAEPGRHARVLQRAARRAQPGLAARLGRALRSLLQPRVLAPLTAVAAVALALLVGQPDGVPRSADLARIEALPYVPLEMRGNDDALAGQLREGLDRYAAGDYGEAGRLLDAVWTAAGDDPAWGDRHQAALYLGLARLLVGDGEAAVAPLEAARTSPLRPVAERGAWYLAQAHLLRGAPEASLPLLETLTESPVYGSAAAEQLIEIRKICDNT
jgi:hypothetical protein